jgi:hypothetical protein
MVASGSYFVNLVEPGNVKRHTARSATCPRTFGELMRPFRAFGPTVPQSILIRAVEVIR